MVGAEVDEAAGGCGDGIAMDEPGGFHGGGFSSDTILLCVQEKGDGGGREKGLVRGVPWDDARMTVELEVAEAELGGASVRRGLGVFARAEAKEEGELDEVGGAGCAFRAVGMLCDAYY